RLAHFHNNHDSKLKKEIVEGLIEFLNDHNALVQLFQTARDKYMEADIPEFKVRLYNVLGTRQYELPTTETVGAIVFAQASDTENEFDLIIEEHSHFPQRVNKLHPCYMSLQFPLLFIYGEDGYHKDMKLANVLGQSTKADKRFSMNMYYSYQMHDRLNHYSLLLRGGKLFQQYIVTAYCAIEQNRLDYIRQKQSDIRNEYLSGIYDAIVRGDRDGSDLGLRTVLTASFTGGPRYMYAHYLDALAICRVHGSPSFFITFTCNAKWPEIEEFMEQFPQLTTADRADIVDRVFEKKVRDYVISFVFKYRWRRRTAEFQKRGVPHCHSLAWGGREVGWARLPDPIVDVASYSVVSELMIHGPCGAVNMNASCMKDGRTCNRHFPKAYCDKTYIDKDGFVHYRRRDDGIETQRQNVWLDNRYVVPYNRTLCMRYYAHINVEYCGWTMLIKYLFKYISKGTDRVVANVTKPVAAVASTSNTPSIHVDEIKNYVEARYIGPHEACWRILDFPIHYRNPPVQTLAVHLENMQQITFRSKDNLESVVNNPVKKKTTLTEWLEYNKYNTDGRHLTYLNFPSEYTWHVSDKYWQRRRYLNKFCIGRLTYVHPAAGDLFYERMLLCHQKGCRSFAEIRTLNGITYPTNKASCQALGLLGGDEEWIGAFQEAALSATTSELRKFFVYILIFCNVADPMNLWQRLWKDMSDDIPRRLSKSLHILEVERNEKKMKATILFDLEAMLNSYSKTLKDFGLPPPPEDMIPILQNKFLMEETNYNPELLLKERNFLIPKLNEDQRLIFNEVTSAVKANVQKLIFVYGHGGTGKTFLWKAITSALRLQEKIVLTVASSGIASLLLPAGRTAHSRFQIPLNLQDESTCNIKKNSQLADLLRHTNLIIWDEAPMNDRRCFEALDRCLKDILDSPDVLFGGRSIMLGGDFRQTLPQPGMTEDKKAQIEGFSSWLLNIGDGTIGTVDSTDTQDTFNVDIPKELCISDSDMALDELINFIYDASTFQTPTISDLQKKVIVCPKNESADMINARVLTRLNTKLHVYLSSDEAIPHGNDGGETELLYPTEYLNSLTFAGLPPHRLELKVGTPIILLRNLNITGGLCNGTRMIVTQLLSKVIEARIITGTRTSEKVFLPRIPLINRDLQLPFIFKRKQFPVKVQMTEADKTLSHSADKGKLPLVEANPISLAQLTPTDVNKTIEARVYRKWIAKNVKTQETSNFCAILLDREGNAIQANMNLSDKDYFDQHLQLNNAYRISRFRCTKTKLWDRTLPNDTTLLFGQYTSIIPISNAGFPEHHFNFIAYNEVDDRANITGAPLAGEATRTRRTRRIIDIQNLDGVNLPFLIWGEAAENFDMNEYATLQKPVIIAVSSAWENKRYGVLQLSSTSATHFYLNPNIPEVHYILSVYANFINPTPALEIQREACSSQIDEQMRNCHTIESLLSVNPQHYEQINFTTQAALLEVTAPNGWYYRKCNACNIKVSENSDISLCPNHGPQPTPNYGYCFKAVIHDGTATTTLTCFSPEAHTFVPDCNMLLASTEDKDTHHVPLALKQAEGQTYIFQYRFGKKARPGYPNFTLTAVLKNTAPPLLALPSAETAASPPAKKIHQIPKNHLHLLKTLQKMKHITLKPKRNH
ncbi:DNA helicase, partial [Tanacetum coccineum]